MGEIPCSVHIKTITSKGGGIIGVTIEEGV